MEGTAVTGSNLDAHGKVALTGLKENSEGFITKTGQPSWDGRHNSDDAKGLVGETSISPCVVEKKKI